MIDPRVAALAAALHDEWDRRQGEPSEPGVLCPACVNSAAAILAALPADWCGHTKADPLRVFGHAVGIILADRKVPDDWDADSLTPEQIVEGTARLLDKLDDAMDAFTAGRVDPVDRTMQRDLRLLSATIARLNKLNAGLIAVGRNDTEIIARLRAALARYGRHDTDCQRATGTPCFCGMYAAKEATE